MPEHGDRFYGALVFTDIEGSSALWEAFPRTFVGALNEHNRVIAEACARHGGRVVKEEGDAFFLVFPTTDDALGFAVEAQEQLSECNWSAHGPDEVCVRIGLHTGPAWRRGEDLWGPEVNRAARICNAGHGGQVLASADFMAECGRLTDDVIVTDLGRCRLRGLANPEHLYQVASSAWERRQWPALRTLDHVPTNLPAQVTSFVGRDAELADLAALLADEDTRLITLTGPGGGGKSRLAIEAAGRALDLFPDGVYWVELSELASPEAVMAALMQVLQVEPGPSRSAVDQIAEFARDRRILLVLDNFEHVVDAADDLCDLLGRGPGVRALVTSRDVLHLPGEHVYDVPPLAIPEPPVNWETLSQYESVHLFLHRAREARPDFAISAENAAAVAEICSRLDGIPLALELAAAWVRMYTPRQILDQLGPQSRVLTARVRGVAERQRTLHAAIEWSYNLLDEGDRRVFRFLSVFRGGFFLDAAEAVCGEGAIESVERLYDCSLLYCREVLDQRRFYMLETVREFAGSRLVDAEEEDQARSAHLEHYCQMTGDFIEVDIGGSQYAQQLQLSHELPNFAAALAWALESGRPDHAAPLATCLADGRVSPVWLCKSDRSLFDRLFAEARDHPDAEWAPQAAKACVGSLYRERDWQGLLAAVSTALEIGRRAGSNRHCAMAAEHGATAALALMDFEAAEHWLEQQTQLIGDDVPGTISRKWGVLGHHQKSIYWAERTEECARAAGNTGRLVDGLLALTVAYQRAGRLDEALPPLRELLEVTEDPGGKPSAEHSCRKERGPGDTATSTSAR